MTFPRIGQRMKRLIKLALCLATIAAVSVQHASAQRTVDLGRVIRAKGTLVREIIEKRAAEGHDITEVIREAKNVKSLADSGKLEEANRLLDRIIVLLHEKGDTEQEGTAPSGDPAAVPDGIFGNPREVEIVGYSGHSMEPFISRDGKYLFFNNKNDPKTNTDLYYAVRVADDKFRFGGEIEGVNTPALEGVPSMDRNGIFYFISLRSYHKDII